MVDHTEPIVVNGRTLDRRGSPSGRVCVVCRLPHGCMSHTVQDDSGQQRAIFVHLPCLKRLLYGRGAK